MTIASRSARGPEWFVQLAFHAVMPVVGQSWKVELVTEIRLSIMTILRTILPLQFLLKLGCCIAALSLFSFFVFRENVEREQVRSIAEADSQAPSASRVNSVRYNLLEEASSLNRLREMLYASSEECTLGNDSMRKVRSCKEKALHY